MIMAKKSINPPMSAVRICFGKLRLEKNEVFIPKDYNEKFHFVCNVKMSFG